MFLRRLARPVGGLAVSAAAAVASTAHAQHAPVPASLASECETDVTVENWSSTHSASPVAYFQPDGEAAIERIISAMHEAGSRIRVVGSKLSPNAIGFSDEAMLDMAQCDAVLSVDATSMQATVQAGARVSDVVEALRPHGLTLRNYASIAEQQIGGFLQVGAHGTGASVPPVDEQVIRMVLHTPALGRLELSAWKTPRLFYLAKVGLGWLGVVSEVTIQCVPAHRLLQHTYVETREGIAKTHLENLKHQHMRYMWIPNTDTVVVVTCDPIKEDVPIPECKPIDEFAATAPLRNLLLRASKERSQPVSARDAAQMNFAQLRDALLKLAPLDKEHVIRVNRAEAEFWHSAQGYRLDWSDKLLGFECGGQQWVSEVAFPCGTLQNPDGRDLSYMSDLLALIEESDLPTPAPIEQRWTRSSRALMSPAYSHKPDDIFSWVGIIMYLPTQEATERDAITKRFWEYNALCRKHLWPMYGAHQHWAKIEIPDREEDLRRIRMRLADRFAVEALVDAKRRLDPKGILGNTLVDTLLLPDSEVTLRSD
uniref:FAD-binding PCMH-type domain-containing protein n=1 Tax=Haptolina brevifila TaxID=156173 RepID=A0A7S2IF32_9EUKA|mmetsp:Transcript_65498/g.129724  ORF Transcript_65498/g.129724 Transcript_65498/m.129724 type:complete len:540 (+) Transcript_65498:127-1746(+)